MATDQKVVLPRRLVAGARSARPGDDLDKGNVLPSRDPRHFNTDIAELRARARTAEAVRELAARDGTLSAAVHAFVQVANSGLTVTAYGQDHQFSAEGTALAQGVLASFDTLYDYTEGFSEAQAVEGVAETLLREAVIEGGVGLELVLNKHRLPQALQPVSLRGIEWVARGKGRGRYPQQRVQGMPEPVVLDIPTFWIAYSHADPTRAYANPPLESALTTSFHLAEFVQDMRRVVKRAGHTRTVVTLDAEKVAASASSEIQGDAEELQAYMEEVKRQVERDLRSINPEDCLVVYDAVSAENLQSGMGTKQDYTPLLSALSGMAATGVKAPPSILGLRLEGGSQALGNIESLIFLKTAAAMQVPVETVLSRALTLSCRLYGADVYVKARFEPIDLRPEQELEAFETMRQDNILEQLALGFITDEEAGHLLGTGPRAPGAPRLSGTMFTVPRAAPGGAADETHPGDTPMGRTLQPDKEVPRKGGGRSQ